jgi:sigma-B regulation protein RsbU (phosphoserine phosphatase)
MALNTLGHQLVVAANADDMDSAIANNDIDIVVLDPMLSGLNCYAFLEDRAAYSISLPVLLVSQGDIDDFLLDCIQYAGVDFVVVPVEPNALQARLTKLAGQWARTSEPELDMRGALELSEILRRDVMPFGLSYSIHSECTREELFTLILDEMRSIAKADAAALYRVEDSRLTLNYARIESTSGNWGGLTGVPLHHTYVVSLTDGMTEDGQFPNDIAVAQHVARTGDVVVIDAVNDPKASRLFPAVFNLGYEVCSALLLPLKDANEQIIAVVEILNPLHPRLKTCIPFRKSIILALESFAIQAAVALSTQELLEKQRMFVKFETDLQVGREVQASFLPKKLPELKGWQMARRFFPARQVSGDFFDVFEIRRDMVALIIADVCDKGVPAALYMALSRSMLRAFAQQNYSLSWAKSLWSDTASAAKHQNVTFELDSAPLREGLKRANDYLVLNHGDLTMFATTFFALLNTRTGQLLYVNAGHNPPVILSAEGSIRTALKPTGPVLGVMENMPFTIGQDKLAAGETLFMYTDGVPDGRDINGHFFSEARLRDLLQKRPVEAAEEIMQRVEGELFDFIGDAIQFDDITMMAVHRKPEKD